jgi:glutathione synthase/RimK-type ligase-like ATP-grasp enzyme
MIALATTKLARGLDHDLEMLTGALDEIGEPWSIVDWDDTTIDWSAFSIVVLRSTWDYYKRLDEFTAWLEATSQVTRVYNSKEIVRWNIDKQYLADLIAANIPVMETTFINTPNDIDEARLQNDIIVKPSISAGSNNTARHRNNPAAAREHIHSILASGTSVLVQPYQSSIDENGETSLVYLDGKYSHAFRKGAIFATTEQTHNGMFINEVITANNASQAELVLGDRVLALLAQRFTDSPLYARIDMVTNANGVPEIMEIELTEPSLYLHLDAEASIRAAKVLASAAAATHK